MSTTSSLSNAAPPRQTPVYMSAQTAAKIAGLNPGTITRRLTPDATIFEAGNNYALYLESQVQAELQPGGKLTNVRRGRPAKGEYHPARGTTVGKSAAGR